MSSAIDAVKGAAALAVVIAVYYAWRHQSTLAEQSGVSPIGRLAAWASGHKAHVLRYTRIAEAAAGVFFVGLGYFMGHEHFHLIRSGARTHGTIVGYRQESFSEGGLSRWETMSLPIVAFTAGDRPVQFKDWMGSSAEVRNVRVVVLYDPANPSSAMIDRPFYNWIPWAPTGAAGLFLLLVALKGWATDPSDG